jgi:hypothetical protein
MTKNTTLLTTWLPFCTKYFSPTESAMTQDSRTFWANRFVFHNHWDVLYVIITCVLFYKITYTSLKGWLLGHLFADVFRARSNMCTDVNNENEALYTFTIASRLLCVCFVTYLFIWQDLSSCHVFFAKMCLLRVHSGRSKLFQFILFTLYNSLQINYLMW